MIRTAIRITDFLSTIQILIWIVGHLSNRLLFSTIQIPDHSIIQILAVFLCVTFSKLDTVQEIKIRSSCSFSSQSVPAWMFWSLVRSAETVYYTKPDSKKIWYTWLPCSLGLQNYEILSLWIAPSLWATYRHVSVTLISTNRRSSWRLTPPSIITIIFVTFLICTRAFTSIQLIQTCSQETSTFSSGRTEHIRFVKQRLFALNCTVVFVQKPNTLNLDAFKIQTI